LRAVDLLLLIFVVGDFCCWDKFLPRMRMWGHLPG
jgi:hypothetical protein